MCSPVLSMSCGVTHSKIYAGAAQGALSQARILGGSVGLAIATIVLNNKLRDGLSGKLTDGQIGSLEKSLSTLKDLDLSEQSLVAQVYADSFNAQMRICTYVSIIGLLAAMATYQKTPASVAAMREKQEAVSSGTSDSVELISHACEFSADCPLSCSKLPALA